MSKILLFVLPIFILTLGCDASEEPGIETPEQEDTVVVDVKLELPFIFSSNMVLQRNTEVCIWGTTDPGNKEVTIVSSWNSSSKKVISGADGKWSVKIPTNDNRNLQTLTVGTATSSIKLINVVLGEVWLCGGQSNMAMPMTGFPNQPIEGSDEALTLANNRNLRSFAVSREKTMWEASSPEKAKSHSAIAHFFGQQLQKELDVPVGIIMNAVSGSIVEAWISKEELDKYPELNGANSSNFQNTPSESFNAYASPIIPFTLKGVIWYQGEGNVNRSEAYKTLFPVMVKDWRTRWGQGDFPFNFVQIAPYGKHGSNGPLMREAQLACVDLIPNSSISIALDVGQENGLHPPKKKEIADRLARQALSKQYGDSSVDGDSPAYDSHVVEGNSIRLKFKYAEEGLDASSNLTGFEIAGDDKVFHPASAVISNNNEVLVTSAKVSNPKEVRYGWKSWVVGSLFDTNGLPASSFRTGN